MLKRLRWRTTTQTIAGHRLPEPRLTVMALVWLLVYLALPLMVLGSLMTCVDTAGHWHLHRYLVLVLRLGPDGSILAECKAR